MKRLFLILIMIGMGLNSVTAQDSDCDPAAVKDWMVQRQIGRNQLQTIVDGTSQSSITDALLLIQKVRRDLEDLPRPACTDDMYELTIYFYNALGDSMGFLLKQDSASITSIITPRWERYSTTIEPLYENLQTIAGVDIMAEAAALGSVPATVEPAAPPAPLQFQGEAGGVVVGPTDVPAGVYKLTLTGTPGAAINISSLSGTCSAYTFIAADTTTSEEVFRSDGCRILIEVSQSAAAWSLVFEPVV